MALKKEEAANKDGATMPDKARYSLPREDESSPPNEFILMATTSIAEDSDQIDVINLSTKTFLVKGVTPSSITIDASDKPCPVPLKTGMVMCLHLFHPTSSSSSTATPPLQLAVGYESGDVILYQISHKAQPWNPQESLSKKSPYSIKIMWSAKLHDQPVIAMDLYKSYLYTASAEEFFTRTNIVLKRGGDGQVQPKFVKTPLPIGSKGASNLVVRKSDGKVVAIACWDSMVRLFSGKSLTPLGIVGAEVHRHGITSLEFVDPVFCINTSAFDETDDTESQQTMGKKTLDKQMRAIEHYGLRAVDDLLPSNMMAVGTSDGRCVLWRVY
ncbi:hypothetical protein BDR26DRAFT_855687 [Obelidium mucronatum]|nr:hypothetical protein BDR26DRAFT_855687 [Obelidium mucronatum]